MKDVRGREIERIGFLLNFLSSKIIRNKELSEITNYLGRRSDFDDITTLSWQEDLKTLSELNLDREKADVTNKNISIDISFDNGFPLTSETELLRLEHKIGVLSSWHLIDWKSTD